jgi:hypothetical protein
MKALSRLELDILLKAYQGPIRKLPPAVAKGLTRPRYDLLTTANRVANCVERTRRSHAQSTNTAR